MSQVIEVKLPDIGDFRDVPVIEILVKPGDQIHAEASIVTLESDKATIDVPSPADGTVKEIKIKVGDKISEGSVILLLETGEQTAAAPAAQGKPAAEEAPVVAAPASVPASAPSSAPAPQPAAPVPAAAAATKPAEAADIECDLLVLGAGPGGYSAAFRGADLGLSTVLVERYPTLGGVCLNVGCIPSKALLHVAAVMDEATHLSQVGISFGKPQVDLARLRAHKNKVVGKLTGGLAAMAKARKIQVVQGIGRFIDSHRLAVESPGARKVIAFKQLIIAAGSRAAKLPFIPDDPRIVDSTGALELSRIPKHLLVIGGGIIGLEMATVYSTLGANISVVEMLDGLMPGADRDLVKVFEQRNSLRFDKVMLKTRVTKVVAEKDGLVVTFEGEQAPKEPQRYDMILVAVGRSPNGKLLACDAAGVAVDERGFIRVDKQMRTNVPHIFAIGDIAGEPMLAHKATHEGHVAAEAAAGHKSFFDARVIPSVAYTDPEIAWVGATETQCKAQGIAFEKSVFPWAASGRAIANGAEYGFTKLLFDPDTHRVIGGAVVGPNAGDLISEVALAIEMDCDAVDIGKTIHPHPTLSESIGLAAEAYEGVCTDLPPMRKK